MNSFIKGTVTETKNNNKFDYSDYCVIGVSVDNGGLRMDNAPTCSGKNCYTNEYYCNEQGMYSVALECVYGCKDGACLKPTACTEEYNPICGIPPTPQCPPGAYCKMVVPVPTTYSNKCMMEKAGASFLYDGKCSIQECKDDSGCDVYFSSCSCSWVCGKKETQRMDCARACPEDSTANKPSYICKCENGQCEFAKECKSEGQMCGGIAGFQCCDGLTCQMDGTYPDAAGKCIKKTSDCKQVCQSIGTRSEGWYDSCTGELIRWDRCGSNDCTGCYSDSKCLPYGTRLTNENSKPIFCDIDASLKEQKQEEAECQNNYECTTNSCSSGKCSDIQKELKETRNLIQSFFDWIKKIF